MDSEDDKENSGEFIEIKQTWYTVITDADQFLTIRKAKTPKEEVSVHFEDLKKRVLEELKETRDAFLAQAYHVELNIQGLAQLKENDAGFLNTVNTKNQH